MFEDDDSPFLTIDETAELLRIKRRTLDNLRWKDKGPPARRYGGRIVYHRGEVLDWSERRRTRPRRPEDTANAPPQPGGPDGSEPAGDREPADRAPAPPVERKP